VLISGPVNLPDPPGVTVRKVETAEQMLAAVEAALPADAAIFAAAVADWRSENASANKIKKQVGRAPMLKLTENPDILSGVAHRTSGRPRLVIGFAAETENVIANAQAKRISKGCDWIVANDVSAASGVIGGVMGGDSNSVHLITGSGVESWPPQAKDEVARALIERIAAALDGANR
jgi:phosphopantothenoylcysteine decarboxylase/phosphopantothenate--cysteine ligase